MSSGDHRSGGITANACLLNIRKDLSKETQHVLGGPAVRLFVKVARRTNALWQRKAVRRFRMINETPINAGPIHLSKKTIFVGLQHQVIVGPVLDEDDGLGIVVIGDWLQRRPDSTEPRWARVFTRLE